MHVGRAEVWRAARPPTDTWQSTAGALRKQPPRDAQQAGVRGEAEPERDAAPFSYRVPIRPHIPHQNPQACLRRRRCCDALGRLPRRPPARSLAKFPTDTSLRMQLAPRRTGAPIKQQHHASRTAGNTPSVCVCVSTLARGAPCQCHCQRSRGLICREKDQSASRQRITDYLT